MWRGDGAVWCEDCRVVTVDGELGWEILPHSMAIEAIAPNILLGACISQSVRLTSIICI